MIDHLSLGTSDLPRSIAFYDATLGALGYTRVWTTAKGAGYGVQGQNENVALFEQDPGKVLAPGAGFHLAITAPSQAAVDAFYAAAMKQMGEGLGGPGLRPKYGSTYYAAFVADPDGRKLEAVHHRANGSSAVTSATYRPTSELHDDRLGRDHGFSLKAGVFHSEATLPHAAPERLNDRMILWNEVDAGEKCKGAQLARELKFSIPREMNEKQNFQLAHDFVKTLFVDRGMVADLNVHWVRAKDDSPKPHAHVMLAMRDMGPEGFVKKNRD